MTAQVPPGAPVPGAYPPAPGPSAPGPLTQRSPAPGPFAPRPPLTRPPLTGRAKRGAAVAGAVSFVLLNIGFALFGIPIVLGALLALFTGILGIAERAGGGLDATFREIADGTDALGLDRWIPLLIGVSVLGFVVMVLAMFTSTWILKAHDIARHWPITWSAAGIAIVASTIVGTVLSGGVQAVVSVGGQSTGDIVGLAIATAVISALVTLAVDAVVGWLAWWSMVVAFRPADSSGVR